MEYIMGKKADEFYYEYRLTNIKTGDVYQGRGLRTVLRAAGLSRLTPHAQLKRSKKWSIEIIDLPAKWDEQTYRKHLYLQTKDRYKAYEDAKFFRDPLYRRRKQLKISCWKNEDGSPFTAEQHETMLQQPCAVCGRDDDTVVDHCHSTLVVRGSLCLTCNLALGYVNDNVQILDNLKTYLLRNKNYHG